MAITTADQQLTHELSDIFDAEHRFLQGQHEMLQHAADARLKEMIQEHITQSEHQVKNLERVFQSLGTPREYLVCEPAQGLVAEAKKTMSEAETDELRDVLIAGAADKVEHYEIASYRALVTAARLMGQREIASLLEENLRQEEETSHRLEMAATDLQQKALGGAAPRGSAAKGSVQITQRMEVVGTDGNQVGHVKDVRGADFLVDRPMKRDLYIPFDAVQVVQENQVILSIPASQVDEMKWSHAGLL